jgi:hypothetical protein
MATRLQNLAAAHNAPLLTGAHLRRKVVEDTSSSIADLALLLKLLRAAPGALIAGLGGYLLYVIIVSIVEQSSRIISSSTVHCPGASLVSSLPIQINEVGNRRGILADIAQRSRTVAQSLV